MTGRKPVLCSKGQQGGTRKLLASQPHHHPWKGGGTDCSEDHHQACRRNVGHQE